MKKYFYWVLVGLVLLVGGVFLIASLETPDSAYTRVQKYIQNEEWEKVYVNLSSKTKQQLEIASLLTEQHLNALDIKSGGKKLSNKERFSHTVQNNKALRSMFETRFYIISSVNEKSGSALLTLSTPEGAQSRTITMVREHGTWVWDLDLSSKSTDNAIASPAIAADISPRSLVDPPSRGLETVQAMNESEEVLKLIRDNYTPPNANDTKPKLYCAGGHISNHIHIYGITSAVEQDKIVNLVREEFPKRKWKQIYLVFIDQEKFVEQPNGWRHRTGEKKLYSVVIK
jgi:hypothetical protein